VAQVRPLVEMTLVGPLLRVENNCIVSKFADITAAYRVTLPELFEGEEDAQALRDAAHVHSGEADEDAQKPCDEQHEVLRREA